jgi:hypothetical protein
VCFSLRLRISELESVWRVEEVHVVFLGLWIVNSVEGWVDSLEGVNLEFVHLVLSGQAGSAVFLVDHVPKGTSRPTGSQSTEHSEKIKILKKKHKKYFLFENYELEVILCANDVTVLH